MPSVSSARRTPVSSVASSAVSPTPSVMSLALLATSRPPFSALLAVSLAATTSLAVLSAALARLSAMLSTLSTMLPPRSSAPLACKRVARQAHCQLLLRLSPCCPPGCLSAPLQATRLRILHALSPRESAVHIPALPSSSASPPVLVVTDCTAFALLSDPVDSY